MSSWSVFSRFLIVLLQLACIGLTPSTQQSFCDFGAQPESMPLFWEPMMSLCRPSTTGGTPKPPLTSSPQLWTPQSCKVVDRGDGHLVGSDFAGTVRFSAVVTRAGSQYFGIILQDLKGFSRSCRLFKLPPAGVGDPPLGLLRRAVVLGQ